MKRVDGWTESVTYYLDVTCPYCRADIERDDINEHQEGQIITCDYCQGEFELGDSN